MSWKLIFAAELARSRTAQHLTQEKVAEMADISPRWYQKLEAGEAAPGSGTMICLAYLLDIDLNVLKCAYKKNTFQNS